MAQFSTSKNSLLTNNNDLYEVVMVSGQAGPSIYVPVGNLNSSADAFGRQRVSEPFTLFDNSFRYGDNSEKWKSKTIGTASVSHNLDQGLMDLTIGGDSGDTVIRETSKVFQYQPGKSLLTLNTFVMGDPDPGVRARVGYFGKSNGFYVEREGSTNYIVKRSSVSGSVVNTRIEQEDWNVDPLDGSGPSGVVLDMSKAQIFFSDFEWLGVGSVRTGFIINGQYIISHIFHHANELESTYITSATLPIRYELENLTSSSGSTLKQICSTVISEGGYTALSLTRTASTPLSGKSISDLDFTPLVSLRLRSGQTDAVVIPTEISLYGLDQAAYKYALIKNPSLSGSSWTFIDSSSSVEYDISAVSRTGGTVVKEGFFVGDNKGGATSESLLNLNHSLQLSRDIIDAESEGEILTLGVLATTNNDNAVGAVTWQEHT